MIPITSNTKLEKVFLDICGPFPRSGGRHRYKYLVIIMDHYTKYIKLYPVNRATTAKVLAVIIDLYVPEIGRPSSIITDHGTQFKGRRLRDTLLAPVSYTHLDVYKRQSRILRWINRSKTLDVFSYRRNFSWAETVDRRSLMVLKVEATFCKS